MNPALLIKLRPSGPWRIGPDSGARDEVELLYHSDRLYAAVCSAMAAMGHLEAWLDATARNEGGPEVSFSSLFPAFEDTNYVAPPRTHWPPDAVSARVRWAGARFIPVSLVRSLIAGEALEEAQWRVDGPSKCLVPAGSAGLLRVLVRSSAAVDRLNGAVAPHATAAIAFLPGAGLWTVASFADEEARGRWTELVTAAFRLLADSGFGGRRSLGWGRAEAPEFAEGALPDLVVALDNEGAASGWWLLSLFAPGGSDQVDWRAGNYATTIRGGRVESAVRAGEQKKRLPMVVEGSVLVSPSRPRGAAIDVAPHGFPHPVYRSGFALAIPVPSQVAA